MTASLRWETRTKYLQESTSSRADPAPNQQSSRHTSPTPDRRLPASSPVPPLCLHTQHLPVLSPAPEHAQPAHRVGRKSVMPSANGPWQLVGKCLMPPHLILSPKVLSEVPHWNMQRPSFIPPCLMAHLFSRTSGTPSQINCRHTNSQVLISELAYKAGAKQPWLV